MDQKDSWEKDKLGIFLKKIIAASSRHTMFDNVDDLGKRFISRLVFGHN